MQRRENSPNGRLSESMDCIRPITEAERRSASLAVVARVGADEAAAVLQMLGLMGPVGAVDSATAS